VARLGETKVFQVDREGNMKLAGGLTADENAFSVSNGVITGKSMQLSEFLDVSGTLNVEEALTLGSEFALTPKGMSIDVSHHSGTLLDLRSREPLFNGSLFELHTAGAETTFLRAVNQGRTTFEVLSNGSVKMSGMRLSSGGIDIEAGGMSIRAGGLTVRGGINLESGDLKLFNKKFHLGAIVLEKEDGEENLQESVITAKVHSKSYVGDILSLSAPSQENMDSVTPSNFNFLSLQKTNSKKSNERLLTINQDGHIQSQAGASFAGETGVTMKTALKMEKNVYLQQQTLEAEFQETSQKWIVTIPFHSNYVILKKPSASLIGLGKGISLQFDSKNAPADELKKETGRIMIITNADAIVTSGGFAIPSQTTIMIVFNGHEWIDLQALKAPMSSLTNIQKLEASSDLAIGNHSFSASMYQSMALTQGSIVFVGKNHFLSEHKGKLSYQRGVFSAPSLKFEKLMSGFDGQGNEITNLQLSNSKIIGGSIQTNELSVNGQSIGLAYFNNKGQLLSSPALALDEANRLLIKEFHSNIQGNGKTISNVEIEKANLTDIYSAHIHSLRLQAASESSSKQSLLFVHPETQEITPTPRDYLHYDEQNGVLSVEKLKVNSLSGPLDGNQQTVTHVHIRQSELSEISSLSTREIIIDSLKQTSNPDGQARLVYTDSVGRLQAFTTAQTEIEIPNLRVNNLQFQSSSIDFHGKTLKNVHLDANSVDFGKPDRLLVKSLVIERNEIKNQKTAGEGKENHFMFSDNQGEVKIIPGVIINSQEHSISFQDYSLQVKEISAETIRFPSPNTMSLESIGEKDDWMSSSSASPLGVHPKTGKLSSLSSSHFKQLLIHSQLVLSEGAEIIFDKKKASFGEAPASSGLLGIDNHGKIIKILSNPSGGEALNKDQLINAQFNELNSLKSTSELTTTNSLVIQNDLYLGQKFLMNNHLTNPNPSVRGSGNGGFLLTVDNSGKLAADPKIRVNLEDHSLRVNSIQPFESSDSLSIQSAKIEQSEISHSSIKEATSIHTNTLKVDQVSEFRSGVTIMGSLMVYGSVSGSGAYIDTSDRRFKKNIQNITSALEKIDQLQAVRQSILLSFVLLLNSLFSLFIFS
jgi:hypothetical protein